MLKVDTLRGLEPLVEDAKAWDDLRGLEPVTSEDLGRRVGRVERLAKEPSLGDVAEGRIASLWKRFFNNTFPIQRSYILCNRWRC